MIEAIEVGTLFEIRYRNYLVGKVTAENKKQAFEIIMETGWAAERIREIDNFYPVGGEVVFGAVAVA
jgi:hypothetical protein